MSVHPTTFAKASLPKAPVPGPSIGTGGSETARAHALLALLCLLLLLVEGWHEWSGRRVQLQEVQTASSNLAHSLLQEAEGAIASADAALVGIVDRLDSDGLGEQALARARSLMAAAAANQPQLRGFSVDGRDGTRLISTVPGQTIGASNANRDYFRQHREDPTRGPLLGPPTRSRQTGEWVLTISRRLEDRDGRFAGVVVTSVSSAGLARIYSTFDVGRRGSIALLHMNGMLLSRYPFDDAIIGRILPTVPELLDRAQRDATGQYQIISAIDGVSRLVSYHRSERFPLLMVVSPGTDEALAAWVRGAWFRIGSVLVVISIILVLGLRMIAQIRRRRLAEQLVARSEAQFRLLTEHASDMVTRVGPDGLRRYASPAARRLLGIEPAELVGRRPQENIHPEDQADFDALVASLRDGHEQDGLTYRARRADGAEIWIESTLRLVRDPATGKADGYVGISRDVTASKEMEAKLAELAATDGLTGIANRRRFDEELLIEWRRAARNEQHLAVMLLDVDHFKKFNDQYGHPAGDDCLRKVASTIAAAVRRPGDRPARYGGEEFAVILPSTDLTGAVDVSERVRAAIAGLDLPHAGNEAGVVTASIGVSAASPVAGAVPDLSGLLEAADGALYRAKRNGRNQVAAAALTPHPSSA